MTGCCYKREKKCPKMKMNTVNTTERQGRSSKQNQEFIENVVN